MPEITFERARRSYSHFVVIRGAEFEEVVLWLGERAGKRAGPVRDGSAIALSNVQELSKVRMLLAGIAESFGCEDIYPDNTGSCSHPSCKALIYCNARRISCPACDYAPVNWNGNRSLDFVRDERKEELLMVTEKVRRELLRFLPTFGL